MSGVGKWGWVVIWVHFDVREGIEGVVVGCLS